MGTPSLNYSQVIDGILELDKVIICAAIAKLVDGKIIASKYREDGSMLSLTREESELSVIQSLIRMSMRRSLEYKLGRTIYSSTVYENVTRASMYVFNHERKEDDEDLILMVSFDKNADHERIINSMILPFLKQKCKPISTTC